MCSIVTLTVLKLFFTNSVSITCTSGESRPWDKKHHEKEHGAANCVLLWSGPKQDLHSYGERLLSSVSQIHALHGAQQTSKALNLSPTSGHATHEAGLQTHTTDLNAASSSHLRWTWGYRSVKAKISAWNLRRNWWGTRWWRISKENSTIKMLNFGIKKKHWN